uniref:Post-GPI attachment to proteins factor 2-like n=1 Tax=Caenorhabditis tropicalis TaxID=1561998 RepID=A0A1I7T954_9PELO
MAVVASTSDDFYANYAFESSDRKNGNSIRIPRNTVENRRLKYGHTEDDNSDIAYLNFPVLVPSLFFTVLSMTCFIGAIITSLRTDYIPDERELIRGYVIEYGSSRFRCNTTIPFPSDGLPSILNLFELNVIGNVLFRYSVCIPIVIRVFNALTIRNLLRHEYATKFTSLHKVMADSMPIFTFVEAFMMALFSIVTVHEDFPVPQLFALMEYVIIAAYAIFHLSFLIDIRNISFICFPRSASGECEPIDPTNFKKGAKYEHCRAFEYNQRRIMSL